MPATEAVRVLDALEDAGCRVWVAGGWGVDALAGRQTRRHRDLDLLVDAETQDLAVRSVESLGYVVETDWLPVRVELVRTGGGWVDVHPAVFDGLGNGLQAGLDGAVFAYPADCFVTGTIGGRVVGCLSVDRQLAGHRGYPPRDVDLTDMALLQSLGRDGER